MKKIKLLLRSGNHVEDHAWQMNEGGEVAALDQWSPSHIPGQFKISWISDKHGQSVFEIHMTATEAWLEDVVAEVFVELPKHMLPQGILWPAFQGVMERHAHHKEQHFQFHSAGSFAAVLQDDYRLALPLGMLELEDGLCLFGTDPTFSTTLSYLPNGDSARIGFSWKWLAEAGIHSNETRRIFFQTNKYVEQALESWFALGTPDIPKGPEWLHDIAMQNYDFLSKDGMGWFADIDKACEFIPAAERHRVMFTLHGWYDEVGRYCFDWETRQFDEDWVAFPHVNDERLKKIELDFPSGSKPNSFINYSLRHLDQYKPVPMNWQEVRRRLAYAKERGFRTCVYTMTGMQAPGVKEDHVQTGRGLNITTAHWNGPDIVGDTYSYNPLHPEIRSFFMEYIQALLEKVGDLTDALVMDEAYYVPGGTLGPASCPGYADRAQMELIKEMSRLCHEYRKDLAFLTADMIGAGHWARPFNFAYCLFADGIYQDTARYAGTWDSVRFPTWRNTAFTCNWAPVSNLEFTRHGVINYGAEISVSNGLCGDDTGLADMSPAALQEIVRLFWHKVRRGERKSISIVDVNQVSIPRKVD